MSSKIEMAQTPAIASNVASIESALLSGYVNHVKIEVRKVDNTASTNTCTVTITDSVTGRTLLVATGITGVSNHYPLLVQAKDAAGAAITGFYTRVYLANQRLTIAVTAGTNTEYVIVYGVISPS